MVHDDVLFYHGHTVDTRRRHVYVLYFIAIETQPKILYGLLILELGICERRALIDGYNDM